MLEYLNQLPCEVLGHNMLGYLELIDIIHLERAASSHKWQPLLTSILPYCPHIIRFNKFQSNNKAIIWFNKKRCRVQRVRVNVKLLCDVDFEHSILDNIELTIHQYTTLNDIKPLQNSVANQILKQINIDQLQFPAVMEVLFSILINSSVSSLNIESLNLSQWMKHIRKIGPCLRELRIKYRCAHIKSITGYCPYLEKLILK